MLHHVRGLGLREADLEQVESLVECQQGGVLPAQEGGREPEFGSEDK